MKAKLLKNLRKQAYKDFGIKDSFKTTQGDVFIVGYKGLNTGNDKAFFSLEDAKKRCSKCDMIIALDKLRKGVGQNI